VDRGKPGGNRKAGWWRAKLLEGHRNLAGGETFLEAEGVCEKNTMLLRMTTKEDAGHEEFSKKKQRK